MNFCRNKLAANCDDIVFLCEFRLPSIPSLLHSFVVRSLAVCVCALVARDDDYVLCSNGNALCMKQVAGEPTMPCVTRAYVMSVLCWNGRQILPRPGHDTNSFSFLCSFHWQQRALLYSPRSIHQAKKRVEETHTHIERRVKWIENNVSTLNGA